jgi:hypothetical protein
VGGLGFLKRKLNGLWLKNIDNYSVLERGEKITYQDKGLQVCVKKNREGKILSKSQNFLQKT